MKESDDSNNRKMKEKQKLLNLNLKLRITSEVDESIVRESCATCYGFTGNKPSFP